MDKALKIPDDQYRQWIADLSKRYQRSQIKAATSVNSEMLGFYWSLGRDIVTMNAESEYAANVTNAPIGISEYQLINLLKDEYKGKLPTIDEIERKLRE